MTFNQKKSLSLFLAVATVVLLSMLSGCSNKAEEQKQQQEKAQQAALKEMMTQGGKTVTVRQPGQSGYKQF